MRHYFNRKGYQLPSMGVYVRYNADRMQLRYVVGYMYSQHNTPDGIEPHTVIVTDLQSGEVITMHHSHFHALQVILNLMLADRIVPVEGTYDKIAREF